MVKSIVLRIFLAVLPLIAVGCENSPTSEQNSPDVGVRPSASVRLSGFVVYGHEVRSFRPCGAEDVLWVMDPSGLLWKLYEELVPKTQPYEELFVVLLGRIGPASTEGFGPDYPAKLTVEQILYAAWEGFSCESELKGFHYRASGNEPFWSAEISDRGMVLKRLGKSDLFWRDLHQDTVGHGFRYCGPESIEPPFEIEINEAGCRDSMSGAFFGYTAALRLGGEVLTGCALKGPTD